MRNLSAAGFTLAALIACGGPAAASGAVWCNANDEAVTFAMRSGVSRGIGGGFLHFTADLIIKLDGAPRDLTELDFRESAITGHWLDAKEFRVALAHEREMGPSGSVVFEVRTQRVSDGRYRGHYTLRVFAQSEDHPQGHDWVASGDIACSAE